MSYKDPADQQAANRRYYERNRVQVVDRSRQSRKQKQEIVREAKSKPCTDCGVQYPWYVMDFDHLDPATKVDTIGNGVHWGINKLLAEIKKCDVVCSNCHRERTNGPFGSGATGGARDSESRG